MLDAAIEEQGLVIRRFGHEFRVRWIYLVILAAIGLRVWGFVGFVGSDDTNYIIHAREISNGSYELSASPFKNRWGVLLPESLLFSLFGPKIMLLSLYPFFLGLLHVYLTFLLGRLATGKEGAGVFSALLVAALPLHVSQSTIILSDLASAVFVTLSLYLVLCSRDLPKPRRTGYLFLSGLSLGWAYLCKEMAVIAFPIYIAFFIQELMAGPGRVRSWWALVAGSAALPGCEIAYYYFASGDPFLRYSGVDTVHNVSIWTARQMTEQGFLWKRLLVDLFDRLTTRFREFGLLFPLAAAGTAWALASGKSLLRSILVWLWLFLLSFNFMSSSLTEYIPLLVGTRFLLPAVAPAAVLAGGFFFSLFRAGSGDMTPEVKGAGTLLVVSIITCVYNTILFQVIFLILSTLVFWSVSRIGRGKEAWKIRAWPARTLYALQAGLIVFVILTPHPVRPYPRLDAQALAIADQEPLSRIYSDPTSVDVFQFLDGYQHPDRFVNFYPLREDQLERGYLWRHDHRIELIQEARGMPTPPYLLSPPPEWLVLLEKRYKNERYVLYRLTRPPSPKP